MTEPNRARQLSILFAEQIGSASGLAVAQLSRSIQNNIYFRQRIAKEYQLSRSRAEPNQVVPSGALCFLCEHINANYDVYGVCRAWPKTMARLKKAKGDRLKG
jgi:hypothetical protein